MESFELSTYFVVSSVLIVVIIINIMIDKYFFDILWIHFLLL